MTNRSDPKTRWGARAALLLVGILWGSSLVVVKASTEKTAPELIIACRFTAAFLLLSGIFYRKLRLIDREYLKSGAVIGVCLFAAYWVQTLGVTLAMPGKSAFLSSIYSVLVPFVYWAMGGGRPRARSLLAAFLCTAGILLSSVTAGFSIVPGDLLALASGLFFAVHIATVGKYGKGKDPVLITILQFGFCALCAWIAVLLTGHMSVWDPGSAGGILYLALFCTALALLLQNVGQRYASPAAASILMSTESVFGVLFSVLFMQEQLNARLIAGFVLILAAVLISEMPERKRA